MESSNKGRVKFIRVEGCKFNVKDALLDISQMFTRIQKEETEKQKMEHLSKEVSSHIIMKLNKGFVFILISIFKRFVDSVCECFKDSFV